MKWQLVRAVAVVAMFLVSASVAFAEKGTKETKTKNATGAITKVDAKTNTIAVSEESVGQQIQTQQTTQSEQKAKAKKWVFVIDAQTKITVANQQQQGQKGAASEEDVAKKMTQLQVGQLVSVRFVQEKKEGKPPKGGAEAAQEEKPKQETDQAAAEKPAKERAKTERAKTVLRAVSIQILPSPDQQQQQQQQQSAKPKKEKN